MGKCTKSTAVTTAAANVPKHTTVGTTRLRHREQTMELIHAHACEFLTKRALLERFQFLTSVITAIPMFPRACLVG